METSQHFPSGGLTHQESSVPNRQLANTVLLDKTIAILGIIFAINVLPTFFKVTGVPGTALTAIRYLLPVIILVRLAARWKSTLRVLQSDLFLLGLNIVIFASFAWSINPSRTILGLRSEYAQIVLTALFLATRFSLAQQVRLITVGMGLTAFTSFLFCIFMPSVGIHQDPIHYGSWRGLFFHKNYFATGIVTTLTACLVQIISPGDRKTWHLWLLGLCAALLLLSTSRTGIVLTIAVVAIIFLYRRYQWRGMRTILILYLMIVAVALGLLVLVAAWDQILTGLGRDPTLSGRTIIWELLRDQYIPQRFILGYGRSSFWTSTSVIGNFARTLGHVPSHAHNGWYDLFLDVGLVGFTLYLLSAIQAWARSFKLAYISKSAASLWPLAFFTVMHLNNYTESLMITRINFLWLFYMAACWSLKEAIVDEAGFQARQQDDLEALSLAQASSEGDGEPATA